MELEDLKQAWSQYDKKLKENLKTNKELLRSMNLDKSKREMQKPLGYEILSIVIIFLTVVFFFGFTLRFITEIKFSIPSFIGASIGIMYLVFAILKVDRFVKIDYYGSPIITVQKKITELKAFILKLRKFEFIFLPLLIVTILPIAFKAIHNIDIYKNLKLFIIEVVFILGVSYPIGFWINRNLYDKKIKDAILFLNEIENFEKED